MVIHTFGAVFGLATSWMLGPKGAHDSKKVATNYYSNLIGSIGTIFLFMYWPSFTAGLSTGGTRERIVINTVMSLGTSCIGAYGSSQLLNHGLFRMEDIMNATLAGGVVIGSVCDLANDFWIPLTLGLFIGAYSSWGFNV